MRDISVAALASSSVAGFLHVVIVYWWPLLRGHLPLGWGRDVVWMAPISYLVIFALVAIPLAGLASLRPRRFGLAMAVGVFTFLAAFASLLLIPSIAQYASLLLAAGLGAQAGRVADRHAKRSRRVLRNVALSLGAVLAAAGVASRTIRALDTGRAIAALPSATPGAPNVLLIILDTVRASSLELYGYTRPTMPALTQLASSSVVFDHAIATAPWTLPTHGTLFFGRYAGRLSASFHDPIKSQDLTLAEFLARHGYATGAFVANLSYTTYETGLSRGFASYEDFKVSPEQIFWSSSFAQTPFITSLVHSSRLWQVRVAVQKFDLRLPTFAENDRKRAVTVNHDFLDWQAKLGQRPFFAFLNYFDAHEPYPPPNPYNKRFATRPTSLDSYDGALAYIDAQLDALLRELDKRGVLDNTLLVVTSDHGEQFGEFGMYLHANSLYPSLMEVPLLIRYPGRVPAGVRVSATVSLRDLTRTIARLAVGEEGKVFPGTSLEHAWTQGGRGTSPALIERSPGQRAQAPDSLPTGHLVGLVQREFEYIRSVDGSEQLFDLRRLTRDSTNLALDPGHASILAELRTRVDSITDGAFSRERLAAAQRK